MIRLPLAPVGKARPRCVCRHGKAATHMPSAYVAWKRQAVAHIRQQWRREQLTRPVVLSVVIVHARPTRKPRTTLAPDVWRSGERIPADRSPDIDNAVGAVMDALTDAGVWLDDRLVVELHASQWWAAKGEHQHITCEVGSYAEQGGER